MPAQKKKIPESFMYNKVEFTRTKHVVKNLDSIKKLRKDYRDAGYYTKVKKHDGKSIFYISKKTKREMRPKFSEVMEKEAGYLERKILKLEDQHVKSESLAERRYLGGEIERLGKKLEKIRK
jgi:hypothetical protein